VWTRSIRGVVTNDLEREQPAAGIVGLAMNRFDRAPLRLGSVRRGGRELAVPSLPVSVFDRLEEHEEVVYFNDTGADCADQRDPFDGARPGALGHQIPGGVSGGSGEPSAGLDLGPAQEARLGAELRSNEKLRGRLVLRRAT
jgi:hypothetical protein